MNKLRLFLLLLLVPCLAMASPGESKSQGNFIVVSKKGLELRVYSPNGGDTTLLARFPACMGKNKGNKQRRGDHRTPESTLAKPFKITMIQDASGWTHNFGDGRGSIKAYGHWFLRLATPGHSGIGIHGSTNNRESVPGRASEGCVRLLDEDIITLKEKYAYIGMPVVVLDEETEALPFEVPLLKDGEGCNDLKQDKKDDKTDNER